MPHLTKDQLEELARRQQADAELYGIGSHPPEGGFYNPRDAYQQSHATAYPPAQYDRWYWFFAHAVETRDWDHLMTPKERRAFDALPEWVTAYRGIRTKNYIPWHVGFSWTLSREVAEKFANHIRKHAFGDPDGDGIVLEETFDKSQIVWLLFERKEKELVIFPG